MKLKQHILFYDKNVALCWDTLHRRPQSLRREMRVSERRFYILMSKQLAHRVQRDAGDDEL